MLAATLVCIATEIKIGRFFYRHSRESGNLLNWKRETLSEAVGDGFFAECNS